MGQASQRGSREQRIAQAKARLSEFPGAHELAKARRQYAARWTNSSQHFLTSGYYDWMADAVEGRNAVLEIGCGVGYSTLTLARGGHSIVAVDENPECLAATRMLLEENGFTVELHLRGEITEAAGGAYAIGYGGVPSLGAADVVLIEGDMLNDPALREALPLIRQFDAVVCWLLGTHQYRSAEHRFRDYGAEDQFGFRILIQNATYELADLVLRPNGILHVVDRGGIIEDQRLIDSYKQSHREQASVTTLIVDSVDHIRYVEADGPNAMPMTWSPPNDPVDGIDLTKSFHALIAVTSIKPS